MSTRKWIDTNGGPIVILPVTELKNWSGSCSVKSIEAQKAIFDSKDDFLDPNITDYGKACAIEDYIGTFDFRNEKAVVLTDEISMTSIKTIEKDVLFIRWVYAKSDEIVEFHLESDAVKNLTDWTQNETIFVKNVDYVMFDSAEIGFDLDENKAIYFTLEIGKYQIKTCEFKPDNETFLLIHKFEKLD